jgi:hypothetical protein
MGDCPCQPDAAHSAAHIETQQGTGVYVALTNSFQGTPINYTSSIIHVIYTRDPLTTHRFICWSLSAMLGILFDRSCRILAMHQCTLAISTTRPFFLGCQFELSISCGMSAVANCVHGREKEIHTAFPDYCILTPQLVLLIFSIALVTQKPGIYLQ